MFFSHEESTRLFPLRSSSPGGLKVSEKNLNRQSTGVLFASNLPSKIIIIKCDMIDVI